MTIDYVRKYLSTQDTCSAKQYIVRQSQHSRGPAVPYTIASEHAKQEKLIKRVSAEMSQVSHEKRAEQPTDVQADNHNHALHNVHERGRREGTGCGLKGKLHNLSRGACVTLLHTNVCERAALENELQRVLR